MTDMDKYQKAALDFANEVRADLKLDPVEELQPGDPGDSCNCPITNTVILGTALSASTDHDIDVWQGDVGAPAILKRDLPTDAYEFVQRFNKLMYMMPPSC